MSQFQKNIDSLIQKELDALKKKQAELDEASKRIAKKVKPQTSIDELVEKAKEESESKDSTTSSEDKK